MQPLTAKPDKKAPLILDLLERFFDDVPVVLPPPQSSAEKELLLAHAERRRHYRKLRNIARMLGGAFPNIGKAAQANPIKYPQYETAYAGGKLIVFGVRQEQAAA